ncbi:MAG: RsmE family RNA methyltransferase [Clostridia bacterium]
MARFFITDENMVNDGIIIRNEDHFHLSKSLRMKNLQKIVASDGKIEYNCIIEKICDTHTECKIISKNPPKGEPSVKVHVYISVTKGDKLELVTQKVTELGACEIIPFISKRSIVKFDEKSKAKKKERLQKIAEESAKQSGRGIIPQVSSILDIKEIAEKISEKDIAVVLYENEENTSLKEIIKDKKFQSIGIIIGPEGGFDETEIEYLKENNICIATLGRRILRAETAPIACVSAIMYETDNLS